MVKIAFLISAFTDAPHLQRFIDSLPADSDCYVHVDASYDITPFKESVKHCKPRKGSISFIPHRIKVMWGSFTQVCFQMQLIRAALDSNNNYNYLFMLSAQDYPVWSNASILSYLQEHQGQNFLQAMNLVGLPKEETYEYTRYRFLNNYPWRYGTLKSKFRVMLRKVCQLFLKKPIVIKADGKSYDLYKGSDYFAITSQLAVFLLETYDHSPQLRRYFSNSFAPSETFAHTVAFNSHFASSCILTQGPVKKLEQLTPLTYIEYGKSIKILTDADFDTIVKSGKMFCRKTVTGESDRLMDMIDKQRQHG